MWKNIDCIDSFTEAGCLYVNIKHRKTFRVCTEFRKLEKVWKSKKVRKKSVAYSKGLDKL